MIRGTSERSETLELEYSTRRIRIWLLYFCLGVILKVIQYNFQNNAFTKIYHSELNSPHWELSNGGLGIAVTLLVRWEIDFLSARIRRPIRLWVRAAYSKLSYILAFAAICDLSGAMKSQCRFNGVDRTAISNMLSSVWSAAGHANWRIGSWIFKKNRSLVTQRNSRRSRRFTTTIPMAGGSKFHKPQSPSSWCQSVS